MINMGSPASYPNSVARRYLRCQENDGRALVLSVTARIQEHDYCLAQNIQNPSDTRNNRKLHETHNGELCNCCSETRVTK